MGGSIVVKKLYNTYSVGEDLTFFELDRVSVKGIDYLLLLQKQSPNIICVGFVENQELQIVNNPVISRELLKIFMKDEEAYKKKLKPFIIE